MKNKKTSTMLVVSSRSEVMLLSLFVSEPVRRVVLETRNDRHDS